jgi:F-type H+-transporting ATPase subunit b
MAAASIEAAGGHVPEGIFLFIPPWYEVILSAVCLGLIAIVMVKFAVPAFLATLDERTAKIEGGLQRAEAAEAKVAAERAQWQEELDEVRAEAGRARDEARADGEAILADARAEAQAEAARIVEAANKQIAAEKKAAEVTLRADVGQLATELAERIVGEALKDQALTGRVIDRFLDDLEGASSPAGGGKA